MHNNVYSAHNIFRRRSEDVDFNVAKCDHNMKIFISNIISHVNEFNYRSMQYLPTHYYGSFH